MAFSYIDGRMQGTEAERPLTTANIPPGTPYLATDSGLSFVARPDGWHIAGLAEVTFAARLASTANLAAISGLAAIDGVTPVAGDIILLKNQNTFAENGLWVAAAGPWSRYTGYVDANGVVARGARVVVREGATQAGQWVVTGSTATLTPGTSSLFYMRGEGRRVFGTAQLAAGAATVNAYIKSGADIKLTVFSPGAPVSIGGVGAATIGVVGTGTDSFTWSIDNPT